MGPAVTVPNALVTWVPSIVPEAEGKLLTFKAPDETCTLSPMMNLVEEDTEPGGGVVAWVTPTSSWLWRDKLKARTG